MHKLENGSQVTQRPTRKTTSGAPGYFSESNDSGEPSHPGADWYNDVIDEFLNALSEAGVQYDGTQLTNLASAIAALRNASNLNAGTIPVARLPAASETTIGAVEKATSAEGLTGTANKFPDAAGVLAAIQQWGYGTIRAPKTYYGNDLDDLSVSGFFEVAVDTVNKPSQAPVNIAGTVLSSSGFQLLFVNYPLSANGRVFSRAKAAGGNSDWFEIFTPAISASSSEIDAGTIDNKPVTPLGLAGSSFGLNGLRGSVQFFMTSTTPAGFIKANAPTLSRTTYAGLYQWAVDNNMMFTEGTQDVGQFGDGDGETTFTGPYIEGRVIRALDETGETDPDVGRAVGSGQGYLVEEHNHYMKLSTDYTEDASGSGYNSRSVTNYSGTGGYSTSTEGGDETRMINVAYVAYIKY